MTEFNILFRERLSQIRENVFSQSPKVVDLGWCLDSAIVSMWVVAPNHKNATAGTSRDWTSRKGPLNGFTVR